VTTRIERNDGRMIEGRCSNVGRRECTGQLRHSWKSASDSKSTAICRPSSDQLPFGDSPSVTQTGGLFFSAHALISLLEHSTAGKRSPTALSYKGAGNPVTPWESARRGFPWEAPTPFRHPQGSAGTSAQSYFGSLMSQFARGILPGWEIARLHEQSARLCGRDPERQLLGSCEFKNLVGSPTCG
jgi:hypothetical protein